MGYIFVADCACLYIHYTGRGELRKLTEVDKMQTITRYAGLRSFKVNEFVTNRNGHITTFH